MIIRGKQLQQYRVQRPTFHVFPDLSISLLLGWESYLRYDTYLPRVKAVISRSTAATGNAMGVKRSISHLDRLASTLEFPPSCHSYYVRDQSDNRPTYLKLYCDI